MSFVDAYTKIEAHHKKLFLKHHEMRNDSSRDYSYGKNSTILPDYALAFIHEC